MSTNNFSLNQINERISGCFDAFICSASYESRCRSVADHFDVAKIKGSYVARNKNPSEPLKDNIRYLESKLPLVKPIELDKNRPTTGADNLYQVFSDLFQGGQKRVIIDITTFTHEATLILIRILSLLARKNDEVYFTYVGAEEYSPGLPDEEKWLSKGIREIRSVLGYPGEMLPSRKIHLIVLVGHETERSRILIDAYEPSLISVGFCTEESSISSKNFTSNQHFYNKLVSLYPDCKKFHFCANDVAQTKSSIIGQINLFPNYNCVVAPMNSKLAALGAALASMENQEVQLCYAQPELYNISNYSTPKDICFYFQLPSVGGDTVPATIGITNSNATNRNHKSAD